jgi:hypothetical protein
MGVKMKYLFMIAFTLGSQLSTAASERPYGELQGRWCNSSEYSYTFSTGHKIVFPRNSVKLSVNHEKDFFQESMSIKANYPVVDLGGTSNFRIGHDGQGFFGRLYNYNSEPGQAVGYLVRATPVNEANFSYNIETSYSYQVYGVLHSDGSLTLEKHFHNSSASDSWSAKGEFNTCDR